MAENTSSTLNAEQALQQRRYFKVQIKAWTGFDPSRMELAEIATEIERGSGFLTAIEVLKLADDVSAIDDAEVRQSFESILAAERLLERLADLPQPLRDKLYAALAPENEKGTQSRAA